MSTRVPLSLPQAIYCPSARYKVRTHTLSPVETPFTLDSIQFNPSETHMSSITISTSTSISTSISTSRQTQHVLAVPSVRVNEQ